MMEKSLSFFLLLIMTSGGLSAQWSVTYTSTDICALEGSSVTMSCSYTYPWGLTVEQAYWINQDSADAVDFSQNEPYRHRVTVDCGDKSRGCSLQMTELTKADAQYQYYCRITTKNDQDKWIGKPGMYLNVTDLKVVSSGQGTEMMEGDHVTLTCSTTCRLTGSPSFIWSKDGRPVEKKQIINNQLQLHPVRYEDGGSYTCTVKGHETFPSPPLKLTVCKNVITSDREAVKVGDHVTLTCNTTCTMSSSPSFIWSKDGRPVEKNQIINNQLQLHPVRYEDGGSYTCAITGYEDRPSPPFRLKLLPLITAVDHSPVIAALVGVAVCGVVGLLCVIYWLRLHKGTNSRTEREDTEGRDDVQSSNITFKKSGQSRAAGPPSAEAAGGAEDDVQYSTIQLHGSRETARGAEDDVQYSTIQPHRSRETAGVQGDDVQYASVHFMENAAEKSSPGQPEGEPFVIYSSVQKRV